MEKKRILLTILGFAVVIVGWILELLYLDWLAIQFLGDSLFHRVLANLVGSLAGLFALGFVSRFLAGYLLGLPSEPPAEALLRFFRPP